MNRLTGPEISILPNRGCLPVVETPVGLIGPGQEGYADALRSFVPSRVVATVEETGRGLRIEFDGGAIRLHPEADEVPGPEIALLSGFEDGRWMCWRPGEQSFEDLA
ncbi:hypothetical protein [Dactylosporangium sp. NPDC051541]|uniref:hypothetical protein n=1 Tax=Dactylosporangium sp. NPDC051541 TaxID=3363977 RepID=UPI003792DBFF